MNLTFRSIGLSALLFCGLACVVTPEPIPVGKDAGGGRFDGIVWKGDMGSVPDSIIALDMMPPPPIGDAPMGDSRPIAVDGAPDGFGADSGPIEGGLEGGPLEGGPLEGGLEGGLLDLGPATDLAQVD